MLTRHGFAAVLFACSAILAGAVSPLVPNLAPLASALRIVDCGLSGDDPPLIGVPPARPFDLPPPAPLVRDDDERVTGRSAQTRATLVFHPL